MKTLLVYFNVDGFAVQLKNHVEEALEDLQIEWKECHISQLVEASSSFQPTMHMFFHPNKEIYNHLELIQSLKGHKLLWSMEDPYESDLTFDMLPYFYYIFTTDENTSIELKKEGTANRIQYVPHACNPKVHKQMEVPYQYKSDVLFVGNAFPSRIKWFSDHLDEYKNKMVTIIGVGYRGLDGYQNQRVIHGHISETEMVKYINGAKFVLNLHRQNSDLDMANKRKIVASSFNNRYYETWACGRVQLIWGRGVNQMMGTPDYQVAHKEHSYKARLTKYYLPLLQK